MARPRKEGLEYFPHDVYASADEKLEPLVVLYGGNGYAFFFMHLEYIYRKENLALNVSCKAFRKSICAKMRITEEEYETILQTSLDCGLFDAERYKETGELTSNGIRKRADIVLAARAKDRERKSDAGKQPENQGIDEYSGSIPEYSDGFPAENSGFPSEPFKKGKGKGKEKDIADSNESACAEPAQAPPAAPEAQPPPAPAVPPCPQQNIIALYHEILPTCPRVRAWSKESGAKLASRWREDKQRQNLDWWRGLFTDIAQSDFLMGRAPTKDGRPFAFNLSWLVRPTNFEKVVNGNFTNRDPPQQQPQQPQYPQRLSPNQAYMLEAARYLKGQGYGKIEQPNDTPRNETPPRALPGGGA